MSSNSNTFCSPPNTQDSTVSKSIYRSPQMRKEALRTVYENAQALQSNVNTKTVENLEQIISEVDTINQEGSLQEKIKDQGEVYLDSQIMTISSHVLKKCTFSLSKNINSYDSDEFAEKIKNYVCRMPDSISIADEEPNWALIGKELIKLYKRTPKYHIVLGTLQTIAKKEIIRKKVSRDAQAPTKRPENVIVFDKEEDSVEQTVEEIFKIIKNYQKQYKNPLDFFALVLHPTDFGKTIENILHVSFLVRDGLVKFFFDENKIPHLIKTSKGELGDGNKGKKNFQNVFSLNMKQWRALVQAYNIELPIINLQNQRTSKKM